MCRDRTPGVLLSGDDGQQWALESATSPGLFLDLDNQVGQSHTFPSVMLKPSVGSSAHTQAQHTNVPAGEDGSG